LLQLGVIKVTVEGLMALAARCDVHSAKVAEVAASPPVVPPTGQATAAAVAAIHAAVTEAAATMGEQLAYASAASTFAANAYHAVNEQNAAALKAVVG
jgi:ABC-type uncharacterized transport system permease subunit